MRDGILKHSKGKGAIFSDNPNLTAMTLEGQIVRIADIAAYVNHDYDDAVRAAACSPTGICRRSSPRELGRTHSERIGALVRDLVESSRFEDKRMIRMSEPSCRRSMRCATSSTSASTSRRTCARSSPRRSASSRSCGTTSTSTPTSSARTTGSRATRPDESLDRAIGDFLCGMTDRYAMRLYQEKRLPRPWTVY